MIYELRRGKVAATALIAIGMAGLIAGCGSTSSKSSARIRAVDVATNALTANILINSASAYGDLNYGSSSPYLYIETGTSSFSYTTSATLPTGVVIPASPTLSLNDGQFYTVYLIGRSDVSDARLLRVVAVNDSQPTSSGQAEVRVFNAAPDAGALDVLINGTVAFPGVAYPAPVVGTASTPAPTTAYQAIPAGTVTVQGNAAGKATVVIASLPITLTAGQAYTLVLTEPTIAPTYALDLVNDHLN